MVRQNQAGTVNESAKRTEEIARGEVSETNETLGLGPMILLALEYGVEN